MTMTIRQSFAAGTALVAITVAASPALAAQEMSYEQQAYEFAQPLPVEQVQPIFTSNPVVQAVPAHPPVAYETYQREVEIEAPAIYHTPARHTEQGPAYSQHASQPVPQQHTQYPAPQAQQSYPAPAAPQYHPPQRHSHTAYPQQQPASHHGQYGGPPLPPAPSFDRSGWLNNCEDELRLRKERSGTAGGLLGAVAGGIIGNRVADSERLGGTLIGAGIGGLAGLAIGSAIGSVVKGNPYLRECKAYLENWEQSGYGQQGYAHGYQAYSYVPAMAYVTTYPIERPVVREYVTEEWVDVPVEHVEYETVTVHRAAPKAVRYTKQKPAKRVKYIKGQ